MSIFSHEFGTRVVLKVLMDKDIAAQAQRISACQEVDKWFVNLRAKDKDEDSEPAVFNFTSEKE